MGKRTAEIPSVFRLMDAAVSLSSISIVLVNDISRVFLTLFKVAIIFRARKSATHRKSICGYRCVVSRLQQIPESAQSACASGYWRSPVLSIGANYGLAEHISRGAARTKLLRDSRPFSTFFSRAALL
ncbi:MAG TPA: hypothetical protein VL689_09175 [Paraburkholderia sp.]|jgi:hypothetical protein|nr:hypothetical protein [Paraburkholderia sp.]